MKNIAFILPSLEDVSPVKAALSLGIELSKTYRVFFVSYAPINEDSRLLKKDLSDSNIRFLSMNQESWLGFFKAKSSLEQVSYELSFDFCISFLFKSDVLLSISNVKAKKISSIRDLLLSSVRISHGLIIAYISYLMQAYSLKRMDKVVVMSQEMCSYVLTLGVDKGNVSIIPNFLDEDRVNSLVKDGFGGNEILFNNDYPTLISISSLIQRKRVDWIIEQFISLYRRGHHFNLLIVGDGINREYYERMLKTSSVPNDRFCFLGHLSNPLPYLKKSNILISASESEGMSRSVMEALYLGIPAVVRDIPGNDELVKKSNGGFLYTNDVGFEECLNMALNLSTEVELGDPFRQKVGFEKYKQVISDVISS